MRKQSTGTEKRSQLPRGTLRLALALLVGSSVATQAASAHEVEPEQSRMEAIENDDQVEVRVSNHNWHDIRVYALRNGVRHRLATVTSLTSVVIRIPKHLQPDIYGVQLLAVPIGARAGHVSPTVYVTEGDQLLWRLENNLNLSSLVLLPRARRGLGVV